LLIRQNTAFSRIIGVQFTLTGRLKGKPRSKKKKIVVGKLSCQTINSKINYSCIHAYTKYGKFGLKLWLHYGNR